MSKDVQEINVVKLDDGAHVAQVTMKFANLALALAWVAASTDGQVAMPAPAVAAPAATGRGAKAAAAATAAAAPPPAPAVAPVTTTVVPPIQQALPVAPAPAAAPLQQAMAPAAVAPPPSAPAQPNVQVIMAPGTVPAELVAATSFRHIMLWMLQQGIKDPAAIVAKCEEFRPYVPAIGRLPADINDRVSRALVVLLADPNTAAAAS